MRLYRTGDAVIVTNDGEELQLHDLKYGRGVEVEAERNSQLMIYGLGALALVELLGYAPKRVRLVIHQPRLRSAPSEWDCSIDELRAFGQQVSAKAADVMLALRHFDNWRNGPDYSWLIGYCVYFVRPNIHYKSSRQAVQDVLFLLPEHRKGRVGYGLIQFADGYLRDEGVQVAYQHVKTAHDFGPLLERMGYEHIDSIYGRRLDLWE